GPRLFVVGRRIHEYHVGLATLGLLAAGEAVGRSEFTALDLLPLLVGTWLVVKDWRDFFPSLRDTSTWTLGIHRRSVPLRPFRATDSVPRVPATAPPFLGVVTPVSTLPPNVRFRADLLEQIEPAQAIGLMHALAVPASLTLLTVAYYLDRR